MNRRNKSIYLVLILGCLITHAGYSYSQSLVQNSSITDPKLIQKDFMAWWTYTSQNIHFSANYVPLDTASRIIDKKQFLDLIISGNFIPIKLTHTGAELKYRLYRLEAPAEKDIRRTIIQLGEDALQKYNMEGTELPDFSFIDLAGNRYTKENTKGKILLLKCWFIHCQQCVEEMPALNDLIKKYKNRKDILFLSLAFDPREKLMAFLSQTKFNYSVIPVEQAYLEQVLKVTAYPTHFIINKNGIISKVVNNYQEMIPILEIEAAR